MATVFEENSVMENASMMVDACRQEFERVGRITEARALKGLEVNSPNSVRLALLTVLSLTADGELGDVLRCTRESLQQALRTLQSQKKLAS